MARKFPGPAIDQLTPGATVHLAYSDGKSGGVALLDACVR
jgi:hypothetical protein